MDLPVTEFYGNERQNMVKMYEEYFPVLKNKILLGRFGLDPHFADDILHDFYVEKIQPGPDEGRRTIFSSWDASRGTRFRSFLLAVFIHFVISKLRRKKPAQLKSDLDLPDVESALDVEVDWIFMVMARSLARFREEATSQEVQAYEARFIAPILEGTPAQSYEAIRSALGLSTGGQIAGVLKRARSKFDRICREVVCELAVCLSEEEVETEMRNLGRGLTKPNAAKQLADNLRIAMSAEPVEPSHATILPTEFVASSDTSVTASEVNRVLYRQFSEWGFHQDAIPEFNRQDGGTGCLMDLARLDGPSRPPSPSLQLLNAVKDVAKRGLRRSNRAELSAEASQVVYCTAVACGVVHHGIDQLSEFSRLPPKKIAKNFEVALTNDALPRELRCLLHEAIDSIKYAN